MSAVQEIIQLLASRGDSQYGGEAVSQIQHALQAATLAEQENASPELIAAALLHDLGHLLHQLPDDAPEAGIDDHHENSARHYLSQIYPAAVVSPICLHVAAKRYLCAVDPQYMALLSEPSRVSLALQGGAMNAEEVADFDALPFSQDAVRLRRWDDAAKDPSCPTLPLSHFERYLEQALSRNSSL